MKLEGIIIMLLFMLMGSASGGLLIYTGFTIDVGITETECFDRFKNEIVGEVCLKEVSELDTISMIIMGTMIMIMTSVVGYFMGNMMTRTFEL